MCTFCRTLRTLKCTLSACTAGSSSTQMVCSPKPRLLRCRRVGPRPRLHPVTSGPRPDDRPRGTSAPPPWLLDLALLTYVSVRSRGLLHFQLCVFSNSVPAPAGLAQTQEDYMSSGGWYIGKCVDNGLLMGFFFFYIPVNLCNHRSSWNFT